MFTRKFTNFTFKHLREIINPALDSVSVDTIRKYYRKGEEYEKAYRIAGNFRGVLIFVIFVTIPRVTKFSTHEFFHPRIFSRLLTSFAYRASGVTKFKTTKINSEDPRQLFTKICTPENYPLYGIEKEKQQEKKLKKRLNCTSPIEEYLMNNIN